MLHPLIAAASDKSSCSFRGVLLVAHGERDATGVQAGRVHSQDVCGELELLASDPGGRPARAFQLSVCVRIRWLRVPM